MSLIQRPFQKLNMLKKLSVQYCNLSQFDLTCFKDLTCLKILLIMKCSSLEIDWNYLNLKWLSLSSINTLEMKTAAMQDLTILVLYNCGIDHQKADKYFRGIELSNLIYLDMSENNLPEIEKDWFAGLCSLRTLKLKSVKLKTLDFVGSNNNIFNLESLDVSLNELTSLENEIFVKINKLKKLNLNYNHISDLKPHVFQSLTRLESLKMKNIGLIGNICKEVFYGLNNLTDLDLSYNGLNSIHRETFIHVVNLVSFDLSGNNLVLDKGCFSPLIRLKSLSIKYNSSDLSSDILEYFIKLKINVNFN